MSDRKLRPSTSRATKISEAASGSSTKQIKLQDQNKEAPGANLEDGTKKTKENPQGSKNGGANKNGKKKAGNKNLKRKLVPEEKPVEPAPEPNMAIDNNEAVEIQQEPVNDVVIADISVLDDSGIEDNN